MSACALSARHVEAEPVVRVRAESRIELGVTHLEREALVEGALRDELGAALPGAMLDVEARSLAPHATPLEARIETDAVGRFVLELPESSYDYHLVAKYAGSRTHRGVRVERRIEQAFADVRLELRVVGGPTLDLDAGGATFRLLAESDAGGDHIALRLLDETGRELGRGFTDHEGRLSLEVPSASLGEPGPGLLRIESLRDGRRAEAQTEVHVLRRRQVQLLLESERDSFEAGSAIVVRAQVRTAAGPRARVPVGFFVGDRHLETGVTDAAGQLRVTLWRDTRAGQLEIRARTEADAAGAYPGAEATVRVLIRDPAPVPLGWVLGCVLAVCGGLLLAARRRAARGEAPETQREPASPLPSIHPSHAHGRRDRDQIHGRVLDASRGAAIGDASVEIAQGGATHTLHTDSLGRFASPTLAAGPATVRIAAPRYLPSELSLALPHRGEWSDFTVKLLSRRDRALSPLRRIAHSHLPLRNMWAVWTTRETRDYLQRQYPARREHVDALSREVEAACYAPEEPSNEDIDRIEAHAQSFERGVAGPVDPRSRR